MVATEVIFSSTLANSNRALSQRLVNAVPLRILLVFRNGRNRNQLQAQPEVFLKELQRGAIDRDRRMWLLAGGPASRISQGNRVGGRRDNRAGRRRSLGSLHLASLRPLYAGHASQRRRKDRSCAQRVRAAPADRVGAEAGRFAQA